MEASLAKSKLFFALGRQLGHDPEVLKNRAKTKFGLASFSEIKDEQLDELIQILQVKQALLEKEIGSSVDEEEEVCDHEYICAKCGKKITIVEVE